MPCRNWESTLVVLLLGGLILKIDPHFLCPKYFAGPFWSHKRNYSIKKFVEGYSRR